MSAPDLAGLIAELVRAGVEPELVGRVAAALALAQATPAPDAAAERRRAYDRERKKRAAASTGTPPEPADLRGPPPEIPRPQRNSAEVRGALARVGDISPTGIDTGNPSSPDRCAWPPSDPPTGQELAALEALLRAEGAPAVNPAAPKILVLAPILSLARPRSGPPCDLNADILPAIRARARAAPPGSITTWDYFVPAILQARDRRLQDLPPVRPQTRCAHDRPDSRPARHAAKQANYARAFAAS